MSPKSYKNIYKQIMLRAKGRVFVRGKYERHHIVPKALGGSNNKNNIAILTYREHFLAHWLLTKFLKGLRLNKMYFALWRMICVNSDHKTRLITSWQYSLAKEISSKVMMGNKFGQNPSESTRRKIGEASARYMRGKKNSLGYKHTPEQRAKKSGSNHFRAKAVWCKTDNKKFDTVSEAAKFYGIKSQCISRVCRGERNSTIGRSFEYIAKEMNNAL